MSRSETLQVGAITVDPPSRSVSVAGTPLKLTAAEYALLERLARYAGDVQPRSALMAVLGHVDDSPLDRALDVHMSRLRRKLGHHAKEVITVRGIGYMLAKARTV